MTDSTGAVVERYRYDAYGKRTVTNATGTPIAASALGQQRGFTGYYEDMETGLYFARARMLSSKLGRFVNRDPLGYINGYSLYAGYFIPNGLDPSGMEATWEDIGYEYLGREGPEICSAATRGYKAYDKWEVTVLWSKWADIHGETTLYDLMDDLLKLNLDPGAFAAAAKKVLNKSNGLKDYALALSSLSAAEFLWQKTNKERWKDAWLCACNSSGGYEWKYLENESTQELYSMGTWENTMILREKDSDILGAIGEVIKELPEQMEKPKNGTDSLIDILWKAKSGMGK